MKVCPQCSSEYDTVRSLCETCRKRNQRAKVEGSLSVELPANFAELKEMSLDDIAAKFILKGAADITYVSSGFPEFDALTGGGFPRGMMTLMSGSEGVGKTSMTLAAIRTLNAAGHRVLFFDVEASLNARRLAELGLNPETLDIVYETNLEDIEPKLVNGIGEYDVIILDSIAAMTTRTEEDQHAKQEFGQANIGRKAILLNALMRLLPSRLHSSKTALICLNQAGENIGKPGTYLPGGRGQRYTAGLIVKLNKSSKSKPISGGEVAGHWVEARTDKSRVSVPFRTVEFKLLYDRITA